MKRGIIITSFGTTYEDTRKLCIEPIEDRIKAEFKDDLCLRAFTSRVIISRLKKKSGYEVDNPTQALEKMKENDIKDIYIQPLLIIEGHEYDKIKGEIGRFLMDNPDFNISLGKPLLSDRIDYENAVKALNINNNIADRALVFMGHGTDHQADMSYSILQDIIKSEGYKNIFIGTVEGEKTIEDIVGKLIENKIQEAALRPFMLVAGDHARNDMASDDEDSWKSILEKNDIKVNIEISGLGEVKAIQDIFIDHLRYILK